MTVRSDLGKTFEMADDGHFLGFREDTATDGTFQICFQSRDRLLRVVLLYGLQSGVS